MTDLDHVFVGTFRRKSAPLIQACLWNGTGESAKAICSWMSEQKPNDAMPPGLQPLPYTDGFDLELPLERRSPRQAMLYVAKLERWVTIPEGQWVIEERDGVGFYPCDPDIFAATYEDADC